MARPKKDQKNTLMDSVMDSIPEIVPIEQMPLETMRDYINYNKEARRLNKMLRICRYPIKPCPVELHPKERIVFGRNDQPTNSLSVYKSDDMIDFKMTLEPGKEYELPVYIVDYLSKKGSPIWKWQTHADGSKETYVSHYTPRFALRTVYNR